MNPQSPQTLVDSLTRSAQRDPQNIALRYGEESITYGELLDESRRLAFVLVGNGLQPGQNVALLMDKSIPAIAAIFGILMAGGCYVPVDSRMPILRKAAIVEDCRAPILFCDHLDPLLEGLPRKSMSNLTTLIGLETGSAPSDTVITVQPIEGPRRVPGALTEIAEPCPLPQVEADWPAFILYAPSDENPPIGARYLHRAGAFFAKWSVDYFGITAQDIFACQVPMHFVMSIFDLYASIWAGATACLVPKSITMLPPSLADLVEREKVTTWFSVPSVLTSCVKHGGLSQRRMSLKRILFAGEVFPVPNLKALMELLPEVLYYNAYGRTETNVCTVHPITDLDAPEGPNELPLGQPLEGGSVWLLDTDGCIDPEARRGELGIFTPAIMSDYYERPEENQACFIEHPHIPQAQIYRTGDWVQQDAATGQLYYAGRQDRMIKIQGNRVENAEVERVLKQHPDVEAALVRAVPTDDGYFQLEAVLQITDRLTNARIRAFCKQHLPGYMVPAHIELTHQPSEFQNAINTRKTAES